MLLDSAFRVDLGHKMYSFLIATRRNTIVVATQFSFQDLRRPSLYAQAQSFRYMYLTVDPLKWTRP